MTGFLAVFCTLALAASSAIAQQASIASTPSGGRALVIYGEFNNAQSENIATMIATEQFDEIWLNSNGGDVNAGYRLGKAIRKRGVITRVPKGAECISACVDAFLGGVARYVEPSARVVVHPGSFAGRLAPQVTRLTNDQTKMYMYRLEQMTARQSSEWISYLQFMGVSGKLAHYAASVPHSCGIILKPQELVFFNIVNTSGARDPGYKPDNPDIYNPNGTLGGCQ